MTCADLTKTTMAEEWRLNPRVLRAKGDRSVLERYLSATMVNLYSCMKIERKEKETVTTEASLLLTKTFARNGVELEVVALLASGHAPV